MQASGLHSIAAASLAIFEHIRDVGRAVLQAKVELEAQQFRQAVPHCSQILEHLGLVAGIFYDLDLDDDLDHATRQNPDMRDRTVGKPSTRWC